MGSVIQRNITYEQSVNAFNNLFGQNMLGYLTHFNACYLHVLFSGAYFARKIPVFISKFNNTVTQNISGAILCFKNSPKQFYIRTAYHYIPQNYNIYNS